MKKRTTKESIKFWIGRMHLWLGLSSGILVFILAITGCIYAFQAEIQDMTQPYRFVEEQQAPMLPPSRLKEIAEAELPGKKVHAVMYNAPGRAAQVFFFSPDPDFYYYGVYLNPYTGAVQKAMDLDAGFFPFILDGHFYLWLPMEIGQPVVATATLVFVVMLISGLILWWPKNKKASKQRFTIKWNARWRRKNYDLHNVLGFYSLVIGLILGFTGLVWGFQWFAESLYWATGGDKEHVYAEPLSEDSTYVSHEHTAAIDRVWLQMCKEYPHAEGIEVHPPETTASPIAANANPEGGTYWQLDYRYFDQYSLKELPVNHIWGRYKDAKVADKLSRMNYDLHTGAVIGLPGKILAFLGSLVIASLPITGFLIWKGRRDKEKEGDRHELDAPVRNSKEESAKRVKPLQPKRVQPQSAETVLP